MSSLQTGANLAPPQFEQDSFVEGIPGFCAGNIFRTCSLQSMCSRRLRACRPPGRFDIRRLPVVFFFQSLVFSTTSHVQDAFDIEQRCGLSCSALQRSVVPLSSDNGKQNNHNHSR
jgi:hypothetical protein